MGASSWAPGRRFLGFISCFLVGCILFAMYTVPLVIPECQPTERTAKQRRRLLTIHVGPPKTGTTTLQVELTTLYLRKAMEQDQYSYSGKIMMDTSQYKVSGLKEFYGLDPLFESLRPLKQQYDRGNGTTPEDPMFLQELKGNLQRELANDRDVIISEEGFALWNEPIYYQALRDVVGGDWDVRIVVTYRRIWACMASKWAFIFSMPHSFMDAWIKDGGRQIGHFDQAWWEKKENFWTRDLKEVASRYFDVEIINMHDRSQTLTTQLACNVLANANHTCEGAKQLSVSQSKLNDNSNNILTIYYDNIATQAELRGAIDTSKITRRSLVKEIAKFVHTTLGREPTSLPLQCIETTQTQSMLSQSLAYEVELVPSFAALQVEEHKKEFQKQVDRGDFCIFDYDAIFADEKWKLFFQQYLG